MIDHDSPTIRAARAAAPARRSKNGLAFTALSPSGLALPGSSALWSRADDHRTGTDCVRRGRGLRDHGAREDVPRPRPIEGSARMSTSGMAGAPAAVFAGLIDSASDALGGRVLGASDEFFAEAANLIEPGRGVFLDGKFTERGKWMDGWESRRRRGAEPDHDWCVLALGVSGEVVGFDVDTNHFLGNHAPFASIRGRVGARGAAERALGRRGRVDRAVAAGAPPAGGSEPVRGATATIREPRATQHLSRRGRRAATRVRPRDAAAALGRARAGARCWRGAPCATRAGRPGGPQERRAGARLLGRVLRPHEQPPLAGPGREHGRRLGDAPPSRSRPRLDPDQARSSRPA